MIMNSFRIYIQATFVSRLAKLFLRSIAFLDDISKVFIQLENKIVPFTLLNDAYTVKTGSFRNGKSVSEAFTHTADLEAVQKDLN